MAGHGSPPPDDRSINPARQVHRDSGMHYEESESGVIREYRPPVGSGAKLSDRGTRYSWDVGRGSATQSGDYMRGQGGNVRTLKRARAAVSSVGRRQSAARDTQVWHEAVAHRDSR